MLLLSQLLFPHCLFSPIFYNASPFPCFPRATQTKHKTRSMHEFSSLDLQGPRARRVSQTKTLHKDLSECLLQSLQSREQKSTDSTSQTLTYDRIQHYNTCIETECVYAGYGHSRTGMQKTDIFSLSEVEAKSDPEDIKSARRKGQHRASSGCGQRNCLQYGG